MADSLPHLWVWKPKLLSWWISILFMIGSSLFAIGCILYLAGVEHEFLLDSVFFSGSIFFTSAAYCQLHWSMNAKKIIFYSALTQFIGTLMFNMNTFDAFFNLGWIEQDLLVWTPNILGSILFQTSGTLALKDICRKWWCWNFSNTDWWIGFINYLGCVAFLISAVLSFATPSPISSLLPDLATVFTLIGACCFFIGALLMLPQMAPNCLK